MAKFIKNGPNIDITNLSDNEVLALLKINVECILEFGTTGLSISLFERLEKDGINYISVSFNDVTKSFPEQTLGYDELIKIITENLKRGVLKVSMKKRNFQAKEPLLLLIDSLKKEIVGSCMMLDYNLQNHVFSLINKKTKEGLPNKLYYFEDNQSLLAFTQDGPVLLYGQTQSIEELICN